MYYTYDYVLVNDDLEDGVLDLKAVIRAARRRTSRMRDAARSVLTTFEIEKETRTRMTNKLVLPKDVDSKFRFITVAAQRAKQVQNGAKPRVEAKSRKPTRVAMRGGPGQRHILGNARGGPKAAVAEEQA